MKEKKALLIVNPSSGGEKAKQSVGDALEKLDNYFTHIDVKLTKKAKDATKFASSAKTKGYHSVFGMGGDGTVSEIINALAPMKNPPAFGFFPFGTVNDLARAMGISLNGKEAIKNFDEKKVTRVDIGRVNDSYFSNVIAIGTVPEAVGEVSTEDKTKFGKLAYFATGFRKLVENKTYKFEIVTDGWKQQIETTTIIIALTNSVGGFEIILPDAKVDDRHMHMIYSNDKNPLETLLSIPELVKGIKKSTDTVKYIKFKNATIKSIGSEKHLPTNVDGDEGPKLPLELEVLPGHLKVYHGKNPNTAK